jgi:hypothetical protein
MAAQRASGFISYRIAIVQSADQVALEAGNSASIIFKHYRELTTPEVAEKWFSILPQRRSVGKHPPLRPQEATRDPQLGGVPVIPSHPRANDAEWS